MEKDRETALSKMRKSVEKLGSSTERHEDPTLLRFLISRSMDTEKAAKMFVKWEEWRAQLVPLGFIPDVEVADELNAREVFLQGLSKDGHALAIFKINRHSQSNDQIQFKKFVVHLLDKIIASSFKEGKEEGNEKLVGIVDMANLSYKNIDARAFITGFQILQAYYPERLAKCFILSMPWFFVSVWKMVCPFLEKETREKVVIVNTKEEHNRFLEEVGVDVLPEEYGGRAKMVALQDVTLSQFPVRE